MKFHQDDVHILGSGTPQLVCVTDWSHPRPNIEIKSENIKAPPQKETSTDEFSKRCFVKHEAVDMKWLDACFSVCSQDVCVVTTTVPSWKPHLLTEIKTVLFVVNGPERPPEITASASWFTLWSEEILQQSSLNVAIYAVQKSSVRSHFWFLVLSRCSSDSEGFFFPLQQLFHSSSVSGCFQLIFLFVCLFFFYFFLLDLSIIHVSKGSWTEPGHVCPQTAENHLRNIFKLDLGTAVCSNLFPFLQLNPWKIPMIVFIRSDTSFWHSFVYFSPISHLFRHTPYNNLLRSGLKTGQKWAKGPQKRTLKKPSGCLEAKAWKQKIQK